MAATTESSEEVGWFSDCVKHLFRLDGVIGAVMLHCVLEVSGHHAHHNRAVIDRAAEAILATDVNRTGRVEGSNHPVLWNTRRTHTHWWLV